MGLLYRTPRAVELYQLRSVQDVRIENRRQHHETGMLKPMGWSAWDRAVIQDAAQTLGLGRDALTLHPSWMYHALAPFWDGHRGVAWLWPQMAATTYAPLPATLPLPAQFVAVKFYARATFEASALTANVARETIRQIVESGSTVVLMDTGLITDDHLDFTWKEDHPRVLRLSQIAPVTAQNNLALQAEVLSRSAGFVGTYGGVAQLALRLGKPSVSLYTQWGGTAWAHRALSEQWAASLGVTFQVLRIGDLPLIQTVLPKFLLQPASSAGNVPA